MDSATEQLKTKLVTASELAAVLRIGQETVRNLAKAGSIPCLRIGRTLRFNLDEVLRAVRQGGADV